MEHHGFCLFIYTLQWLPQRWEFQWIFLVYRWLIAAYYFAWLFPSGLDSSNGGAKYFIYLTNWCQLAWAAYLIVAALSVTVKFTQVHLLGKGGTDDDLQETEFVDTPQGCCGIENNGIAWYQKAHWLFFNVGAEAAVTATVLYWVVIYDNGDKLNGVNLNTHLTNGILALFDLWFSGTPVRLLHGIYVLSFACVYVVFTGIYYAADGTNAQNEPYIYGVLDYEDSPGTAVAYVLGVVLVFLPLVHVAFYVQYVARYWITYALFRGLRRQGHTPLDLESGGVDDGSGSELK